MKILVSFFQKLKQNTVKLSYNYVVEQQTYSKISETKVKKNSTAELSTS